MVFHSLIADLDGGNPCQLILQLNCSRSQIRVRMCYCVIMRYLNQSTLWYRQRILRHRVRPCADYVMDTAFQSMVAIIFRGISSTVKLRDTPKPSPTNVWSSPSMPLLISSRKICKNIIPRLLVAIARWSMQPSLRVTCQPLLELSGLSLPEGRHLQPGLQAVGLEFQYT